MENQNKRYFVMGNALVVGIIEKIASTLKNELKNNNFRQK
jgi:site-specific DNA-cytosine methylase